MNLHLNEQEQQLLKNVLHAMYKTYSREPGMNIGTCRCTNINRDDLNMIIDIHDRIVQEELEPSKDKDYFVITRVHRDDLETAGFDASEVDDDTMKQLAKAMANDYLEQLYWVQLPIIAENLDIPRKECEPDLKKDALDYVRSQIDEWKLKEYRAQINSAYECHTTPTAYADFDKINDLLEEYGEENDLPEGWWLNEGDLDEWLYEL